MNHIEWLKSFVLVWDFCNDENMESELEALVAIYQRYIKKHKLPVMSADELILHITETRDTTFVITQSSLEVKK